MIFQKRLSKFYELSKCQITLVWFVSKTKEWLCLAIHLEPCCGFCRSMSSKKQIANLVFLSNLDFFWNSPNVVSEFMGPKVPYLYYLSQYWFNFDFSWEGLFCNKKKCSSSSIYFDFRSILIYSNMVLEIVYTWMECEKFNYSHNSIQLDFLLDNPLQIVLRFRCETVRRS